MGDGPDRTTELKMPSREAAGGAAGQVFAATASSSSPFLPSPFTNFSHVPAACAAAAGLACRPLASHCLYRPGGSEMPRGTQQPKAEHPRGISTHQEPPSSPGVPSPGLTAGTQAVGLQAGPWLLTVSVSSNEKRGDQTKEGISKSPPSCILSLNTLNYYYVATAMLGDRN